MKITSDGANKLMKKLEDEKAILKRKIENCATFVAAVSEDEEKLRPVFDFKKTYKEIDEIEYKIIAIKHARSIFNNSVKLKNGMTIGEALVMLPILKQRSFWLSAYANKQSKTRNPSIGKEIEYTYINYDSDWVKAEYKRVCDEIYSIQEELNLLNSTEIFEIEI